MVVGKYDYLRSDISVWLFDNQAIRLSENPNIEWKDQWLNHLQSILSFYLSFYNRTILFPASFYKQIVNFHKSKMVLFSKLTGGTDPQNVRRKSPTMLRFQDTADFLKLPKNIGFRSSYLWIIKGYMMADQWSNTLIL